MISLLATIQPSLPGRTAIDLLIGLAITSMAGLLGAALLDIQELLWASAFMGVLTVVTAIIIPWLGEWQ